MSRLCNKLATSHFSQARGYVLMPVIVTIALLAAIAYMISLESSISLDMAANDAEAMQAQYITEAGLHHALAQTQSGSCTAYPDPLTASFGGHIYTANVTPGSGTPVSIAVTGTLSNGTSRSLQRNNVTVYQTPNTVNLQPDPTEGQDAHVDQSQSTWNYGADPNLIVNGSLFSFDRSLVQFDLSAIPAGVKIISAKLELRSNSTTWDSTTIDIHRVTKAWIEGAANGSAAAGVNWTDTGSGPPWDTAGGDFDATVRGSAITPGNQAWVSWDIAGLVSDWVNGKAPNYGLMLRATMLYQGAQFDSSDAAIAADRPKLTITYACECGAGSAGSSPLAVAADTYLATGSNVNLAITNYGDKTTLTIGNHTNEERSLLKFDLSVLPAQAVVSSAILELNYEGSGTLTDGTIEAFQVTVDWLEMEATWNIPKTGQSWSGGQFSAAVITSATVTEAQVGTFIAFDISAQVQSWHDGSDANNGLLLAAQGGVGYGTGRFTSSDNASTASHPKLTINYTCPCGVDCSGGGGGGPACKTYGDNFETAAFNNNDGSEVWAGDWIEDDSAGTGASAGKVQIVSGELRINGVLSAGGPSIAREVDLSAYTTATLAFDYRTGSGVEAGEDSVVVEVSGDGGAGWTVLEDFINETASASGSRSYDISAYIATNTQVRFRINAAYGGPNEYFYVDNLVVSGDCGLPAPTGPIAHWKLDDGTGLTAVDSEGGHDGILTGVPAWTTGEIGGALDFDGADDYVDLTSDAELDDVFVGGATVMAWIYPRSWGESDNGRILDKSSEVSGDRDGWMIAVKGDSPSVQFAQGFTGVRGYWRSQAGTVELNNWVHVAVVYDASSDANDAEIYLDGVKQSPLVEITPSGTIRSDASISLRMGNHAQDTSRTFDGNIDDVRIYGRMLTAAEIADLAAAGSGDSGGGPGYNETFAPWSATTSDTWETVNLSAFGVPANAVVEVAVVNANTSRQYWGGVRKVGSSLDRRLQLHEAESGGSDVMVMHVQADALSQIEHYSDTPSDVTFVLLGYWGTGTFVETWNLFNAGTSGSWTNHALGGYGVPASSVVEVVAQNHATTSKSKGGVRGGGSGNDRFFEIDEAESGGIDAITLFANADASSTIEVYAESDANIDFYLVGYWSVPPGSYTESAAPLGKPSNSATWESVDLVSEGAPVSSVANIVLLNAQTNAEAQLGVREVGSSHQRLFDLQEAEGGGSDLVGMHVNLDASGQIEWYDENTQTHEFWLMGWWVLP